ncbi:hypothetical protein XBKB1_1490044 [Xenorhabdus bovienii str. kraussei Becker Underwood]|uniref:Peptidase S1 domain-containing protein n=1 Tax=Xenorhabdus bovienii str. kraussei Becker Underwood TaxID=1398204 RepID=A0A077PRE4_XENBV|nr:hypothetical protein XBKB1_1490044 [Xenorhabdus bovienii str. kraussei Becker Underwood]
MLTIMVVTIMSDNYNDMGLPSGRNNPVEKANSSVNVSGGPNAPYIPWVVKIFREARDEHGVVSPDYVRCSTGFLVSHRWILTARHAVEQGGVLLVQKTCPLGSFAGLKDPII